MEARRSRRHTESTESTIFSVKLHVLRASMVKKIFARNFLEFSKKFTYPVTLSFYKNYHRGMEGKKTHGEYDLLHGKIFSSLII